MGEKKTGRGMNVLSDGGMEIRRKERTEVGVMNEGKERSGWGGGRGVNQ
jgi:hypothetical protein